MLSIPHLIIIFLVALVVLGPEKLPQVARVMGKAMADFRRITTDFRVQIEDEMQEMERQARLKKEAAIDPVPSTPAILPPADTIARAPVEPPGVEPPGVEPPVIEPPVTEPPPSSQGAPTESVVEPVTSEPPAREAPATEKRGDGDFHTA